ncbi:3-hexulose-6-phosphate isomerase [Macadamia integrifolia]|uniref:3-hexulose-6-phosphate isomerase n=1 Tax=Macadamia integrifolia TaxID=60698 RepID=UPI001C4F9578|nr:3-hexulose-6-phosphate isomerase [Macadamia integrifolia]
MAEQNDSMSAMAIQICNQIQFVLSQATEERSALEVMVEEITGAAARSGRVFVNGVGREGLMLKALCMRLAHLGLSAHCVGDMTTPPISSQDLLITSAGPGCFSTVDAICGVARSNAARVLLLTAQPKSGSAAQYATAIAFLPAQTMADDHQPQLQSGNEPQLLPMGSLYEGVMFVLFEMVVFRLAKVLGQTPEAIRSRHTNLE